MRSIAQAFVWWCFPALLGAQTPAAGPAPNGLTPDWDMGAILREMSTHAKRLGPLLERVDAKAWVEKGASETYATQLQSAKDQARTMALDAQTLSQNPEKLSAGLELYFRIEALDRIIANLVDGLRKYQDRGLADDLASLAAENGANRGRFQAYIVNLATEREQECAVADREAQRCRGMVATQPPPASSKANTGRKK
jgi:hypothetical protein